MIPNIVLVIHAMLSALVVDIMGNGLHSSLRALCIVVFGVAVAQVTIEG